MSVSPMRPRRQLPMWSRFAIALTVAAALVIALIRFVDGEQPKVYQPSVSSRKAVQQENQEARVVVGQDQAPHVAKLAAGAAPAAAMRSAVTAYMDHQIKIGTIGGPVTAATCGTAAGGSGNRVVLHCQVRAAQVEYPFDGVVQPAAGRLTYCKVDPPPVPSMRIPVSSRCT